MQVICNGEEFAHKTRFHSHSFLSMLRLAGIQRRVACSLFARGFANAFLGNELQSDLKRFYLLVHPDVMGAFPESVKTANKNSIQVAAFPCCHS